MRTIPRLFLILFSLLISGCATIKSPLPESVSGAWEHSNLFYSRLELDNEGNGYVIYSFKDSEVSVYSVNEYQSLPDGFSAKFTNIGDETEVPEIMNFVLYELGILCIKDPETGDEDFCFMKSKDLVQSKASAMQALENLNNKKRNAMDGSVEPPIR